MTIIKIGSGILFPRLHFVPPAIRYDMVSVSGSTLLDQSGNGNDGTLHGTTPEPLGISFNGSSDYIAIPAVVKNSDFTVIAIATADSNPGSLWYEGDAAQNSFMRLFRAAASSSSSRIFSSGGDSGVFGATIPAMGAEYHAYYLRRSASAADTGMVELPYSATAIIPGNPDFSGDVCASIGAQSFGGACASQNIFLTGRIVYWVLFTIALTAAEIQEVYNQIRSILSARGVYLQDLQQTLITNQSPIWTRRGQVLAPAQEPSVLYEPSNGQLISGPCIKMWFTRSGAEHYGESSDGISWTVNASPVIAGTSRMSVLKDGATYYGYIEQASGSTNTQPAFDCYTSANGISWTLLQASVLVRGPGTYDDTSINNPNVTKIGSAWVMVYESLGSGIPGTQCNLATSSDGINWVKSPANPITGFNSSITGRTPQGPHLYQAPTGRFYIWGGGKSAVNTHADVSRFESSSLHSLWAQSIPGDTTFRNANIASEISAGDPAFVEMGGVTYMFYGQTPSSGDAGIGLATTPLPLSDLVQTTEGAIG